MKKFNTRTLVISALLVAISIILKTLAYTTPVFAIRLFELPLIFIGFLFGPFVGLVSGFVTDWMYVMISPWAFSFNLMTLSTMMIAFIPGLMLYKKKEPSIFLVALTIIITGLVAFSLNTMQLYIWSGNAIYAKMLPRIIVMVIKWPLYTFLFKQLYRTLRKYK